MAKTYLPEFVKLAYRMNNYLSKHKSTMIANTSDTTLIAAINAAVAPVSTIAGYIDQAREKP